MTEDPRALAAHQLRHIGIFLLRHDRRAGAIRIRQAHEAEARARPQDELLGEARQVHHQDRGGATEFDREVPVGHGVERVLAQALEAELPCHALAIDREAGAGERGGAEGQPIDPAPHLHEPFTVALEHLHIRHQVMAEGDGLRHLQMGEARHDQRGVALGLVHQRALQVREQGKESVDLRAQPQPHVGRDLVVARARGMQALARIADQRGQPALDVEMDILGVERPAKAPGVDLALDACQPTLDRRKIAPGDDALCRQHAGVGARSPDVILGQPPVEADRGGKALDPLVDGRGEARRPGRALFGHKNAVQDPYVSMVSIRQKAYPDVLPDFRNVGVVARVLIAVNAAVLAGALFAMPDFVRALEHFVESAALVEPLLLLMVTVLFVLSAALRRLPYLAGAVVVTLLVAAVSAAYLRTLAALFGEPIRGIGNILGLCVLLTAALLIYFRLLTKAHSPALAEARLQALQALIRPHFLLNSLNAVLALIRRDPRRAERSLEDLADLFRTLMSDARQFVRLADEIPLLERYAEIEQRRLGERLRITWDLDSAPSDALLPPLVLQPLLENAVYHGVEPGTGASDVLVRITRRGDRVLAQIENPYLEAEVKRAGNRMALENIRERLQLFFDAEARITIKAADGRYSVELEIPYKVRPV